MNKFYKVVVILLLMVIASGVSGVDAQSIKDRFKGIFVEGDAAIGGTITLQNGETIANATDGFISLGGGQLWNYVEYTPTAEELITPTVYSAYNLSSSAAISITLAVCTEGGPLILSGDDANNVQVNDTNIRTTDGAAVIMGQYDVTVWFCVDSEWLQIVKSADS